MADDPFPALTGGGELADLLFPLADVSRALGQLPLVAELGVDELHRIMVETALPESGGMVYCLDSHFHVVDYRTSDNLAPLHERLFRQHLLDHRWSTAENAAVGKVIPSRQRPMAISPGCSVSGVSRYSGVRRFGGHHAAQEAWQPTSMKALACFLWLGSAPQIRQHYSS